MSQDKNTTDTTECSADEHYIVITDKEAVSRDSEEYRVIVIQWPNGDFEFTVGGHYGFDEQGEPQFFNMLRLEAPSREVMKKWILYRYSSLLSFELRMKLSRILNGEKVVR